METSEGFRGEFSFLSNFTLFEKPFKYGELTFDRSEHFYQAMKFDEQWIRERVQNHPAKGLKAYVQAMDVYFREDLDEIKEDIMLYILRYKFSKDNPKLRQKLIDTEGIELVEYNSWGDTYWGVCLKTGKGLNRLGNLLMQVREEILCGF
ncbi:GTP cyclohydrolase II [Vibrio phage RYC]|nr:GTP cyclohydrolase II [Vibrio phage RYC]